MRLEDFTQRDLIRSLKAKGIEDNTISNIASREVAYQILRRIFPSATNGIWRHQWEKALKANPLEREEPVLPELWSYTTEFTKLIELNENENLKNITHGMNNRIYILGLLVGNPKDQYYGQLEKHRINQGIYNLDVYISSLALNYLNENGSIKFKF